MRTKLPTQITINPTPLPVLLTTLLLAACNQDIENVALHGQVLDETNNPLTVQNKSRFAFRQIYFYFVYLFTSTLRETLVIFNNLFWQDFVIMY